MSEAVKRMVHVSRRRDEVCVKVGADAAWLEATDAIDLALGILHAGRDALAEKLAPKVVSPAPKIVLRDR